MQIGRAQLLPEERVHRLVSVVDIRDTLLHHAQ